MEPKRPSIRSVFRWFRYYEESNGDIRSLVDALDNCGQTGRFGDGNDIIDQAIWDAYMKPEQPSIRSAHDEVLNRFAEENAKRAGSVPPLPALRVPTYGCIYHRIKAICTSEAMRNRFGSKKAGHEFQWVEEAEKAVRPGQVWEFDCTPADLMTVDVDDGYIVGRPYVTAGYDRATGICTGFHLGLEPPGHRSVMECLLHSILPKDYIREKYPHLRFDWPVCGVPEAIAIDRGREFKNRYLYEACAQLGISIIEMPPRTPWYKGAIERFLKKLNYSLLHGLPGTTFSNVYKRGDYDPAKHAVLDIHDLYAILHLYIVDRHNRSWNRRLKGAPIDLWTAGVKEYPLAYPASREDLRILLLATEYRIVGRQGIELFHLFYHCQELASLRSGMRADELQKPVALKYDVWDLSKIWVYHRHKGAWFEVAAVDREYTANMSLYRHQANLDYLTDQKMKIDPVSLAQTSRLIAQVVKGAYSRTRRAKARKKLAMLQAGYKPATHHTADTPIVPPGSYTHPQGAADPATPGIQDLASSPFPSPEPAQGLPPGGIVIKGIRLKTPRNGKSQHEVPAGPVETGSGAGEPEKPREPRPAPKTGGQPGECTIGSIPVEKE